MEKLSRYEVVIIGAGAAGLSAAKQFKLEGISSLVILEACDRIGGRVNTVSNSGGFIDLGAQWIHGQLDNELYDLASRQGLIAKECSVDGEGDFMTEKGKRIDPAVVESVIDTLDVIREDCCCLREKQLDNFPPSAGSMFRARFEEYLNQCTDDDHCTRMLKLDLYHWITRWERVDNACNSLHQVSARLWGDFKLCGGYYNMNPKYGMTSLIQCLNQQANASIRLNSPVTKIDFEEDLINNGRMYVRRDGRQPVLITCSDGSQYECQHVVVTPSLGYLKLHAKQLFTPSLPQSTLQAIENVGFGVIGKIFLEYEQPWWNENFIGLHLVWTDNAPDFETTEHQTQLLNGKKLEMEDFWYRAITGFDPAFGHKSTLCGWIGGPEAAYMETLSEETLSSMCTNLLRQFLKNPSIPSPTKVYRSQWQSDPYFLGSYSYRSCASRMEDIEALNQPLLTSSSMVPLMVLAGEANSSRFFSTIHGAMTNGRTQSRHYINFKTRTFGIKNKL